MRFKRAKLGGTVVEPILRSVGVSLEGSVQEAERSEIHLASLEPEKWVNSRAGEIDKGGTVWQNTGNGIQEMKQHRRNTDGRCECE